MNGGIKIGRWTLTKQSPHIVTAIVFLTLKCFTSSTNKWIYTNTVYSGVLVLAPSLSLAVMQYQLISYTITLQWRGEQSSYIKANSYMKGLGHSNKHCMWSCNCGGWRVAWEWLTIHYKKSHSHKCSALFPRSQGHCHWWFSSMVTVTGSFFSTVTAPKYSAYWMTAPVQQ